MASVVRIERLGREGDGIAGSHRIPFALPGELWRPGLEPLLLEPADERVTPPCPHFGVCGGCTLQHAEADWLARWKAGTVVRALAAQGIEAEVRPTMTSPPGSRRRAVLAGRRTRKGALVGLHERKSEGLVEIPHCRVLKPAILAALPALEELARIAASRSSEVQFVVTAGPNGIDVDVRGGQPLDFERSAAVAATARSAALARLSWDRAPVVVTRPPWVEMGRALVVPPPGAFLQATEHGEAALVSAVQGIVGDAGRVIDLFAGCGTFALPLGETAHVVAVEGERAMLDALASGTRLVKGLRPVLTLARDLFRRPLLAAELDSALGRDGAVVIDPPRAGAEAQCRELAQSGVVRVASVSCNPATFARDARVLLDGGFRLEWVQPVDQFLWSGHVELVAAFTR